MSSADGATPKYPPPPAMLDSPMEEATDPLISLNEAVNPSHADDRPTTVAPADMSMRPPPLPAHVLGGDKTRELTPALSTTSENSTSPEEAQQALRILMKYIEEQQTGFDMQDFVQMGKLMEKLKVHSAPAA